ncbi:MAG: hypothetical protein HY662_03795, partial [Chloroflexi bacterium]|nr:hypothetical protein [Chloroflexota bacterium]
FLDYFSDDPMTKIILMYVEGVKDGKRFANSLRRAAASKPVIITKGGRGKSGTRAVASHTASLAGSSEIWSSLITQAGAVTAENLDDMIDFAAAFYFLPPTQGKRVGVAGGGGGACVLAADECEESGLDVVPLPDEIRQEMKERGIPTWDWVSNPADMSITGGGNFPPADMLQMMNRHQIFDLLIANMREYQGASAEACYKEYALKDSNHKPLLVVTPDEDLSLDDIARWQTICAVKTKLLADGIPFYPTVKRAATAASQLINYYRRRD